MKALQKTNKRIRDRKDLEEYTKGIKHNQKALQDETYLLKRGKLNKKLN